MRGSAVNLLLFDVDGTLTDTSADDDRFFREALTESLPVDAGPVTIGAWDQFAEVTHPAIAHDVITRACGRRAREGEVFAVRRAHTLKWQQALDAGAVTIRARPGAREIVEAARQRRQFSAAIATGGWGPTALLKLTVAGFPVNDLVIATADDSEKRVGILRTAEIFAAAGRSIPGFDAIVVIGDGIWDARAARAAHAGFVGVAEDPATIAHLRSSGAAVVIPNFEPPEDFWNAVDAALALRRASTSN